MWLHSLVCVGPGQKPRRPVFLTSRLKKCQYKIEFLLQGAGDGGQTGRSNDNNNGSDKNNNDNSYRGRDNGDYRGNVRSYGTL